MKSIVRIALVVASLLPLAHELRSQPSHLFEAPPFIPPSPVDPSPQPFDVLHYSAEIELPSAPAREIIGVCDITFVWKAPPTVGPFIFHLRDLTIDSVLYDGVRTEFTTWGEPADATYHHQVGGGATGASGDTAVVRVYYHGRMTDEAGPGRWGGVSSSDSVLYALGVGFSNNYVSATQHWLPCYDHPSDKATFEATFTVPAVMQVASNGLLTRTDEGEGTRSYLWRHDIPCATYLLTFAASTYVPLPIGTTDGGQVPMVVYAKPVDSSATRRSFSLLPRMVETYEERFTPYPFEKVGYVNTPQGAMEHQTMVSFPTSLARSGDSVNTVGAHELAHQWFGDLVSPLDFRHAWLNESFATFCEAVWLEDLFGQTGYLGKLQEDMDSYLNSVSRSEGVLPLYDFPRTAPSSNYPATIYVKGAVVVGMLRYELGDSLFFTGLAEYLDRYAYGNATTDDLIAVLEEVSGRELDWFFDEWVRRKGWPELQIEVEKLDGGRTARLTITQVQNSEYGIYTNLPVEIGFLTEDSLIFRMVRVTEESQTITVELPASFTEVTVNEGPTLRTLGRFTVVDATSAVPDSRSTNDQGLLIVPNPENGEGTIEVSPVDEAIGPGIWTLFDGSGEQQGRGKFSAIPFRIATTALSSGTYRLVVESGDERFVTSFVIQR